MPVKKIHSQRLHQHWPLFILFKLFKYCYLQFIKRESTQIQGQQKIQRLIFFVSSIMSRRSKLIVQARYSLWRCCLHASRKFVGSLKKQLQQNAQYPWFQIFASHCLVRRKLLSLSTLPKNSKSSKDLKSGFK